MESDVKRLQAAIELAVHDNLTFDEPDDNGEIECTLYMNDCFGYASCFMVHVPWDKIIYVNEIYKKCGHNGLIKWCSEKEGLTPLPQLANALKVKLPPCTTPSEAPDSQDTSPKTLSDKGR